MKSKLLLFDKLFYYSLNIIIIPSATFSVYELTSMWAKGHVAAEANSH